MQTAVYHYMVIEATPKGARTVYSGTDKAEAGKVFAKLEHGWFQAWDSKPGGTPGVMATLIDHTTVGIKEVR